MKPTCDRCGRPMAAAGGTPGTQTEPTCSCDRVPAVLAGTDAPKRFARDSSPLPAPREGNVEVDPWSLPAPDGGYENLDLDDAPAAAAPDGAAAPAETPDAPDAAPDAAPDIASSVAARADAEPAEPPARSRKGVLAGAAVAVLVVAAIGTALLVRGRPSGARGPVRVTVTQEAVRWDQPPPLAPVDPSFVERARPAEQVLAVRQAASFTRPPAAPARPARATPPARTTMAASAPLARAEAMEAPPPAAPEPSPVLAGPEPQPAQPPPAPVTAADIPLPPPPAIPQPRAAPAQASTSAKTRPPVLDTRTCVADALNVPRGLEGRLPAEVVVHVDVSEDGRAANVSFPGAVDPRLRTALVTAVRTCRFTPGADASGRPVSAATTMRLRFE